MVRHMLERNVPVFRRVAITAALLASATHVAAELPSVRFRHGRPITPAQAWSYFGTATTSTSNWTQRPAEIKALARSLGANRLSATDYADAVQNYIQRNIRVEFRFGLSKGAVGAIQDQSGTPFDQAHLMVELLREGGVTASYVVGSATMTGDQFGKWTGLVNATAADALNKVSTFTVSSRAACEIVSDGGIPSNLGSTSLSTGCQNESGNLTSITIGHIWVSANGRSYDPSFKQHELWRRDTGLTSAACPSSDCSTPAISAMMTGATLTGTYLQNPNVPQLATTMRTQAVNVENRAKALSQTNLTHLILEQLIGGRKISNTQAGGTSLPYTAVAQYTWTGGIPNQFRTTAAVSLGSLFSASYYLDETAGRKLQLPNFASTASTFPNMSITLNHPYPNSDLAVTQVNGTYQDESESLAVPTATDNAGNTSYNLLTLVLQTGTASASSVAFMTDYLKLNGPGINTCGIDNNKLYKIGTDFVAQFSQALKLIDGVNASRTEFHHAIGMVAEYNDYDASGASLNTVVSANMVGGLSMTTSPVDKTIEKGATGAAEALFSSIEGSAIEQTVSAWSSGTASDLFRLKAQDNTRFYIAASTTQWNSVKNSLSGYTSAFLTYVGQYVAAGYTIVIPREATMNGTLYGMQVNDPRSGFIAWKPGQVSYAAIDHKLGKGAGSGENKDPVKPLLETIKAPTPNRVKLFDPNIDATTGRVNVSFPPDLTTGTGDFPYALSLTRTYSSDATGKTPCIIYIPGMITTSSSFITPDLNDFLNQPGWKTSGDWDATIVSDPDRALGSLSAIDAGARIAGVLTLSQLARVPTQTIQSQMAMAIGGELLSDQLELNGVRVSKDGSSESYIRAADGVAYLPEPWKPGKLTKSGPDPVKTGFLDSFIYNYAGIAFQLTEGDGAVTNFDQFGGYYPTFGDSNDGQSYQIIGPATYINRFKSQVRNLPGSPQIIFTRVPSQPPTTQQVQSGVVTWQPGGQIQQISNSLGRAIVARQGSLSTSEQAEVDANGAGSFIETEDGRWVKYVPTSFVITGQYGAGCGSPVFHGGPCTMATNSLGSVTRQGFGKVDFGYQLHDVWYSPSFGLSSIKTAANTSANPDLQITYNVLNRAETMKDAKLATSQTYPAALYGETTRYGTSVDPLGAVSSQISDEFGKPVSMTDPLGRAKTAAYDQGGNQLAAANPEGDQVTYKYDLRGNRTEERKVAKPGSGLADLVKQTFYMEGPTVFACVNQVTCNKPSYEIDPKGIRTNYTWNATTGLLETMTTGLDSAGNCLLSGGTCPVTTFTYSDFTGFAGVVFKLLTAKTETIAAGQTVTTAYEYDVANKFVLKAMIVDPTGLNLRTCFRFDTAGNLISKTEPKAGLATCS